MNRAVNDSVTPPLAGTSQWRRPLALAVAALCAAAAHQWFVLHRAFHDGPLSGLHPWDDCTIVERPLWPLAALSANPTMQGLVQAVRDYAPRGPIAELQSFVAVLVSGGDVYAPYLVNGWAEALAVLCVVVAGWRLRAATVLALLLLVMAAPVTTDSILSLKGDYKGGLLIAAAIFILHEAAVARSRQLSLFGTAVLSLALTAKLTAFFLPVWALATLVIFEVLRHGPTSHDRDLRLWRYWPAAWRGCWRERRTIVGLALLLGGPFVVFFGWALTDGLYWYIRMALGPSWRDGLTVLERTAFYVSLPGPIISLSAAVFGATLLGSAISQRRPDHAARVAATFAVAIGILLPFVLATTSIVEYGAFFQGALLGSALVYIRAVSEGSSRAAKTSLAVVLATILLFLPESDSPDGAALRESKATTGRAVEDIRSLGLPAPRVFMLFEDRVAGFPNLSLLHFTQTGRPIDAGRIDFLDPPDRLRAELDRADVVLTLAPTGDPAEAGYRLRADATSPATMELERGDRLVAADERFQLVHTYPWRGAQLKMYGKVPVARR